MQNRDYAKEYKERALDYMKALARMEKRFQSRSRYLQRLQVMAEGDSPSQLRTVSGGALIGLENMQDRLAELDRELAKELVYLQAVREQTWELLSRLSHPKAGQLLEEFYLNGTSIRVIAARTAYNERYVYRIKNQALRELGKLLQENGIEDPSSERGGETTASGYQ